MNSKPSHPDASRPPDPLDDYAERMNAVRMPARVASAVMRETARVHADQASGQKPAESAQRAPAPSGRAAGPRARKRPATRALAFAACVALAAGVGAFALAAQPALAPDTPDEPGTTARQVSSDALPAGNFFTLAAYADETSQPAQAGTTIELDASGIRPLSYANAWVDPETGEQADWRAFAGMKAGINASVVGNNVESVTYSIEGDGAYLEAIADDPPTQEAADAFESEGTDVLRYKSLQRAKSFTLDYDDVALENGASLGDAGTILSIYLKVPVPDATRATWEAILSGSADADNRADIDLDVAGAQVLTACRLCLTATFTDGSTQTKQYAFGTVPDFEQRVSEYWENVTASTAALEAAAANGEEPSEELLAQAEEACKEPVLYTLTEVTES